MPRLSWVAPAPMTALARFDMRKGSERVLVVHGTTDVAESAEQGLRLGVFEALLTDDP